MINSKLKSEKGISLITLTIVIVILIIITNVLIYNVKDNLQIQNLKSMQNDIDNLSDKISSYYVQYGKVPAKIKYTNIQKLKNSGILSEVVDTEDEFYIIDLASLENLTLNYGQDYKNITPDLRNDEINKFEDLYIINLNSHNIFYVLGITIDNETFYTNYTKENVDTKSVDLRYVNNVKIPDNYVYVKGDLSSGIRIKSKTEQNKEYVWVQSNEEISKIPDGIIVDNEEEFIKSVNIYKGYYKNTLDNTVIYLQIEDGWSLVYDKEGIYVDKNGDSAYIPQGFKVSKSPYKNMIDKGLVIKDENENSYVWIQVPKNVYVTAQSETEYEKIEADLQNYTLTYKEGYEEYSDIWYNGCGIATEQEYNELKNKMLSSIYSHGGFWISQYEIGADTTVTSQPVNETRQPVSKEGMYPYSYVTCSKAQELASNMNSGNKTSSLLFGIQWNLVCKFIENNAKNPGTTVDTIQQAIKKNSQDWSNVYKAEFEVKRGKYSEDDIKTWSQIPSGGYLKGASKNVVLTTGASDRNSLLNIYDFSGNVWEWTLEYRQGQERKGTTVGGGYKSWSDHSMANRRLNLDVYIDMYGENAIISMSGFRVTIY